MEPEERPEVIRTAEVWRYRRHFRNTRFRVPCWRCDGVGYKPVIVSPEFGLYQRTDDWKRCEFCKGAGWEFRELPVFSQAYQDQCYAKSAKALKEDLRAQPACPSSPQSAPQREPNVDEDRPADSDGEEVDPLPGGSAPGA